MLCRAIKRDEDGFEEWLFGHSFADYRNKQNQIMQDIYTALYEWKYDCFFALENGIDWYTRLGTKGQKDLLDNDINKLIQKRPGVLAVYDFNSSLVGREYSCSCQVVTEYTGQDDIVINFTI